MKYEILDTDISDYIKENFFSCVIPSFELIQITKNNFKTCEQIKYDEQLSLTKKALHNGRVGNIIAIVVAIVVTIISILLNIIFRK